MRAFPIGYGLPALRPKGQHHFEMSLLVDDVWGLHGGLGRTVKTFFFDKFSTLLLAAESCKKGDVLPRYIAQLLLQQAAASMINISTQDF